MNAPSQSDGPNALTAEALVKATDKLGALIVTIREDGGDDSEQTQLNMALDVFTTLWRLRWELSVFSGDVQPAKRGAP